MESPAGRSRSIFRAYVDELRRTRLFDAVRARASEPLKGLLDDPRSAPAWIDPALLEEVTAAINHLRGRDAVRELGYNTMKTGFGKIFEPIIHVSLMFVGSTPTPLFNRANMMLGINSRGVAMNWKQGSPTSGTMEVRTVHTVPATNWTVWEGPLLYVLELAGVRGIVGAARPAADGRSCEIDVSWEGK